MLKQVEAGKEPNSRRDALIANQKSDGPLTATCCPYCGMVINPLTVMERPIIRLIRIYKDSHFFYHGTYRSDQINGHCTPQELCEEILQNNYELKRLCSRWQSSSAMRLSSQDIPRPTASTLQLAALSNTKVRERRLQGNEC
jgi:hypothetical protein